MKLIAKTSLIVIPLLFSCEKNSNQENSNTNITDVAQSRVKDQSLGNCWAYAVTAWAESLYLSHTGEEINISESYWQYWHWYTQIANKKTLQEVSTGGSFELAKELVLTHGFMLEEDFIPEEADTQSSARQSQAELRINEALRNGILQNPENRTPENIMKALDQAFKVNMNELQGKIKSGKSLVLGQNNLGEITLFSAMYTDWQILNFPMAQGEDEPSIILKRRQDRFLKRIMRALNDKKPVVISIYIDLNAEDGDTFRYNKLVSAGSPGMQGHHMVVLEDYMVKNLKDQNGNPIEIHEGEMSQEIKGLAVEAELDYFVAKNSWGTSSLDRGPGDGYIRFDKNYMVMPIARKEAGDTINEFRSTLKSVVLPNGY